MVGYDAESALVSLLKNHRIGIIIAQKPAQKATMAASAFRRIAPLPALGRSQFPTKEPERRRLPAAPST
jgi:hypothetical protein